MPPSKITPMKRLHISTVSRLHSRPTLWKTLCGVVIDTNNIYRKNEALNYDYKPEGNKEASIADILVDYTKSERRFKACKNCIKSRKLDLLELAATELE